MKDKGFTLIEILLVFSMSTIVAAVLVAIVTNNTSVFYQQNSVVNSGLSLNDATMEMSKYIKQASLVGSGYPEAFPQFISGVNTLVLKIPSYNVTGIIGNTYDYVIVTHDLSNPKILRLQVFPDPASLRPGENKVLTTLLDNIEFNYLDKSGASTIPTSAVSVKIALIVLSQLGSFNSRQTANFIVGLRNSAL